MKKYLMALALGSTIVLAERNRATVFAGLEIAGTSGARADAALGLTPKSATSLCLR